MHRSARHFRLIASTVLLAAPLLCAAQDQTDAKSLADSAEHFTLQQVLDYPFPQGLVAAEKGDRIAWVINLRGVRNVWIAQAPDFKPKQLTHFTEDDGQELTNLTFSPSGDALAFVRGGDHDENWPAEGNLAPDPAANPKQPKVTIWAVRLPDGEAHEVTEGDAPAISAKGRLAYIKEDQVWTASLDYSGESENSKEHGGKDSKKHAADTHASGEPKRLFFDRGKDSQLQWSPEGTRLAVVSDRDDHSFIGVYTAEHAPRRHAALVAGRHAHRLHARTRRRWPTRTDAETDASSVVDLDRGCRERQRPAGVAEPQYVARFVSGNRGRR